jgi:preprotein translocase subunit YajC
MLWGEIILPIVFFSELFLIKRSQKAAKNLKKSQKILKNLKKS